MAPTKRYSMAFRDTLRQSQAVRPGTTTKKRRRRRISRHNLTDSSDSESEDIRARNNSLQYELEALRQERELEQLRHQQELREAQSAAEEAYQRIRVRMSCSRLNCHIILILRTGC
jgi:hypothetical protein